MKRNIKAIVLVFLSLNYRCLLAQDFNIPVCTEPGDQDYPALTWDGFGHAIVVWHDRRAGNNDLYAQKINLRSDPLWQIDGVPVCTEPSNQGGKWLNEGNFSSMFGAVKITWDGSGGAIMCWRDDRNDTEYGDIYAQRIYANGQIAWDAAGLPICTASNEQSEPQIVSDGAGGAIITWEDYRAGNVADIYAQRIDGSGNVLWQSDGIVVSAATAAQHLPQIATDANGGAIIVWQDLRSFGMPQYDLYAQRVSPQGNLLWQSGDVPVCRAPEHQYLNRRHAVVQDGSGGALITWHDARTGIANTNIYAQRLTENGSILWKNNGVAICTALDQQTYPTITGDGQGGAYIVWQDLRNRENGTFALLAYGQHVNESGFVSWHQDGIQISFASTSNPLVIGTTPGEAVFIWEDYRDNNFSGDLYMQRYSASGQAVFPSGGQILTDGASSESQHNAAHISDGNFIVAWQDFRNGNDLDIYAAVRGKEPIDGQSIGIKDRFFANNPGPIFLPLLRNDILSGTGNTLITIANGPRYGTILSVEENGVWYQPGQDGIDEFGYSITQKSLPGGIVFNTPNVKYTEYDIPVTIYAFLCYCQLLTKSHCTSDSDLSNIADPLVAFLNLTLQSPINSVTDDLDIQLLVRARDEVLGSTTTGAELAETMMFNSPEILQALVIDRPDLLEKTLSILGMMQTPARSLLYEDGDAIITAELIDALVGWLSSLLLSLSPELQQILQSKLLPLGELDSYIGLSVKEAAETAFDFVSEVRDGESGLTTTTFELQQNYPNPFNPITTIQYTINAREHVRLVVYDIQGRKVETLLDEEQNSGTHQTIFESKGLASGVYYVRLKAGLFSMTRKMVLIQ